MAPSQTQWFNGNIAFQQPSCEVMSPNLNLRAKVIKSDMSHAGKINGATHGGPCRLWSWRWEDYRRECK